MTVESARSIVSAPERPRLPPFNGRGQHPFHPLNTRFSSDFVRANRRLGGMPPPALMAVNTDILPPRYRSPKRIASGGMGEIYRATDAVLGRAVAVKLLAERYSRDEGVRQRFTREALAAARLSGEPHIVTIFDVGEHGGRPFIVMEYLSGGSLEQRIRRDGAQKPGQALEWLEQAAIALDAAHRNGVVHRDVKPANLLLDRNGNVHVADFGIASAAGMDSLTMTGTVLGTAGYLSPEQAQGERATPASDLYALAVVAFELLSGRRPFENESMTAEAAAHVNAAVPSIAEICEGLPDELDPVFRRAMAKDPGERYPSAQDFVAAMRGALADAAGTTRSFRPVAAAAPAPPRPAAYRPPRRGGRWALLAALLALGAIGGAIAAVLLTDDGGGSTAKAQVRTVVRSVTVQGRTVRQTTTVTTTAASPPPSPPPASTPPPPASPPAPSSASGQALNDAGYRKMRAGDYSGALPLLRQAVRKLSGVGFPYEAYANYNLGYTLLQLGSCDEALGYLKTAQRLEPDRREPKDAAKRARACSKG
jgi:serine/threonine-protein kinase